MTFSRLALAGATAALIAPAAASGATIQTDLPCYLEGQPVGVAGTGWGPGTAWSYRADQIFASGTVEPTGNFLDSSQTAPIVPEDTTKATTVTLTGQQDGTDVASTTFQVVNLNVKLKDDSGKPTGKTKWSFSGFEPSKPIYVHVRRKGKTYTAKAGASSAPCGILTKRLRRLPAWPAKKIAYGKYKIAVDNRKAYGKPKGQYNQFTASITVFPT